MRKSKKGFRAFVGEIAIPFLTVFVIVTVALVVYMKISRIAGDNFGLVYTVMILTVFVLAVAFVVADRIQRKITTGNPVSEILEATEKIARGDFSVRLTINHAYERYNDYDLIKENLNAMAEELNKSEILKTDFIANVSHELKTPLSVIQSYVSLIEKESDPTLRTKYVHTVKDATKRLSSLITNVLKLNRLEHHSLTCDCAPLRLDDLIAESVIALEEKIEDKALTLDCHLDEVELSSHKGYLEIVFTNLLSNAVKFTEPGGSITVRLTDLGDFAQVDITDTGCGIPPETGARIFDKFYQGDTSHAGEGNGLGLALVKRVIDILGGKITVKSRVGEGSTFSVTLKKTL